MNLTVHCWFIATLHPTIKHIKSDNFYFQRRCTKEQETQEDAEGKVNIRERINKHKPGGAEEVPSGVRCISQLTAQ